MSSKSPYSPSEPILVRNAPCWHHWKLILALGIVVLLSTVGLKSTWNALHFSLPVSSPAGSLTAQDNQQITGNPQWQLTARGSIVNVEYAWVFNTREPLTAAPAVSNDEIFLVSGTKASSGRIHAVDAPSGNVIWEVPLNGIADHSPIVADDSLFVVTRGGDILSIAAQTGSPQWSFDGSASISGLPIVLEGVLYAGASHLYALDAETGKVRWGHKVGNRVVWPLAVSDGVVAALASDNNFYLVTANNGTRRLTFPLWFKPVGGPVISDQTVAFSGARGNVQAMALSGTDIPFEKALRYWRTKLFLWDIISAHPPVPRGYLWQQRELGGHVARLIGGDAQRVYLTIDDAEIGGRVVALDGSTGKLVWEFKGESQFAPGATMAGPVLVIGTQRGRVHGIDINSGESLWNLTVGGPVSAAPALSDDMLLVPSSDGKLYAIDSTRTFGVRARTETDTASGSGPPS
jgi:outer membrane protein assembly factor BamB